MNIEECLRQGLLVKAARDSGKAKASLKASEHKLQIAGREFEAQIYESAIISAYGSMFHSARALLFKDGYKERSHYAVWVYLSEKYAAAIERKYLNELSHLRLQRHDLLYGLEMPQTPREDTQTAIEMAGGFLERVRQIANKNHF